MQINTTMRDEIELKLSLGSFPDYLKLLGALGSCDRDISQTNGFFDTEDRQLASAGWALRVRAEREEGRTVNSRIRPDHLIADTIRSGDEYGLVTLKGMTSIAHTAAIRKELEARIPYEIAQDIIALRRDIMSLDIDPVAFVRDELGVTDLARLICFHNSRSVKNHRIGDHLYQLEIDKTEFPDSSVEYELEVELGSQNQIELVTDHLQKMFGALGIPFRHQRESKFARALGRSGLE